MFNLFLNIFKPKNTKEKEQKLKNLKAQAERVVEQLEKIPRDFCPERQKELIKMAKESVNPMLRRLRPLLQESKQLKEKEIFAYQSYKKRLKEVKQQVRLIKEAESDKMKKQAFLRQSIQRVLDCIDRDIHLLKQYCMGFKQKNHCILIQNHIDALQALKCDPQEMTVNELPLWRSRLAIERANIVHDALESMDRLGN